MRKRCRSLAAFLLAIMWGMLFVCSDDVVVYADWNCQESGQLSSAILEVNEVWIESNSEFVLQDSSFLKNRIRNSRSYSRIRVADSVNMIDESAQNLVHTRQYAVFLQIVEFSNEKIIMNYLHRQDGDK